MKSLSLLPWAFAALLGVVPVAAQSSPAAPCKDAGPFLTSAEQAYCVAIAQAAAAAQPQLGILISGGNPTPGSIAVARARFGTLPRFSAGLEFSVAPIRIPDVQRQSTALIDQLDLPAPALSGSVAIGLFPGFSTSPGVGGIGSLDLLGSVHWLPFRVFDGDDLDRGGAEFAYGIGARAGIVRESFGVPGIAASVMYRRLERVRGGQVCAQGRGTDVIGLGAEGYDLNAGLCTARGDPGEFSFDLNQWSGRLTFGTHLGRVGVIAGAGLDRFGSDLGFALGTTAQLPQLGSQPVYVRAENLELDDTRWSLFGNASYSFVLTSLVAEVGWMQGGEPLDGFDSSRSEFDPGEGVWFGSVALRFGL